MSRREQYALSPADAAEFYREWSVHLDALDSHLSSDLWEVAAVIWLVITFPIARVLFFAAVHTVVPDVVRTVLHLTELDQKVGSLSRRRGT